MLKTHWTQRALFLAEKYCAHKIDECGKPVLDRLLYVAERMDDELKTCAALMQGVAPDTLLERSEIFTEFPRIISDIASIVRYDPYLYFDYLDEPYEVYLRGVLSNRIAEKVVLEDLRYRINLKNYNRLSVELMRSIQRYRDAFRRIGEHISIEEKSGVKREVKTAVKTDCCCTVVPKGTRHCPSCGKRIVYDEQSFYFSYEFNPFATVKACWYCRAWMPATYRYCSRCGQDLRHPREITKKVLEFNKDENES